MRVLWFTNIELPAARRRQSSGSEASGGWMESLRLALVADGSVRLGVAAAGVAPFEPFDEDSVRYYHLDGPPVLSGVSGVAARWSHRTDDAALLAQASAVIDAFRPDLVHVHGSERAFGLLSAATSVPVLVSLQGILLVCSRAYLSGIPATDIGRDVASLEFAKGRGLVHAAWDMRVAARRELRILESCSYFSGRTDWDRAIVSDLNPRAAYYHVDEILRPEFYQHEWRPPAGGPFVIYTTGGPDPYKGLVSLLEAVALLRASVRPDVKLRVAGAIQDSRLWPVARRAVARYRLQDAVEWLGPLAAGDVVSELCAAGAFVHPSFVDNSPNSVAEAMIVGVPCVASSAGGVPSLLDDGREGLLFSPGDVSGLARAVGTLAAEPALAARLGANARRRALRRHDPHAIVRTTTAMYDDIVSRDRARG